MFQPRSTYGIDQHTILSDLNKAYKKLKTEYQES